MHPVPRHSDEPRRSPTLSGRTIAFGAMSRRRSQSPSRRVPHTLECRSRFGRRSTSSHRLNVPRQHECDTLQASRRENAWRLFEELRLGRAQSTVGFIYRPTSATRGVLVEARALGLRANRNVETLGCEQIFRVSIGIKLSSMTFTLWMIQERISPSWEAWII